MFFIQQPVKAMLATGKAACCFGRNLGFKEAGEIFQRMSRVFKQRLQAGGIVEFLREQWMAAQSTDKPNAGTAFINRQLQPCRHHQFGILGELQSGSAQVFGELLEAVLESFMHFIDRVNQQLVQRIHRHISGGIAEAPVALFNVMQFDISGGPEYFIIDLTGRAQRFDVHFIQR